MKTKILAALLILSLAAGPAGAAGVADTRVDVYEAQKLVKSVVFKVGEKEYFIDNRVPGVAMDVAPYTAGGRTFIPVRFLSNALGVTDKHIAFKNPAVTLTEPGFPAVELAVGSKTIKSGGTARTMDVAPAVRGQRTFLPARFVAEALGYQVEWDAVNQVVVAWAAGQPKPDVGAVLQHLGAKPQPGVAGVDPVLGRYVVKSGYKIPVQHSFWSLNPRLADDQHKAELALSVCIQANADQNFKVMRAILESKFSETDVDLMLNRFEHKVKTRDAMASVRSECLVVGGKDVTVGSNARNSLINVVIWGDVR
ncbi:MAG: copper amine oxidase N-terminal domain-containing protein [Bacillota bacterium]